MTISQIVVLLHYYTTPWNDPLVGKMSVNVNSALSTLLRYELLAHDESPGDVSARFKVTGRGEAYVKALMSVHLPEPVWRIPDTPSADESLPAVFSVTYEEMEALEPEILRLFKEKWSKEGMFKGPSKT